MPKLPQLSGQEVIHILERFGFEQVRQKGSHVVLKKKLADGDIGCVVPIHREIAQGTLRSILKQAHLTPEEFLERL